MNEPLTKESILSDNFRETREDLFAIRREITQKVANHFDVEVRGDVNVSPEAYSLYIRALEYDRLETKEDNQLAIATLSQAIEKDANFLDAYVKLASNQLLNHERGYDLDEKWLNEVEQNINKVLAKDESRADCFWLLGRLYIQRGDHKKGVENLEKAIELNSNQMRPYVTLGEEYATNLGDPAKALTYFQQAYDLEPTNFNISVNIGIANAMIKNYDEAEKAFRKATNQNRTHELPWINLGYLYELLGKGDSAEIAFMNAAERNPKNPETAKHLAFMLINRGRVAQAESALTSTLKFESSNDELSYILGIAQEKRGKIKEAKETWKGGQLLVEAKIKDNPNVPELYFYLGLISARLGEKEKAVTNAMTAVRMDSTDDNVMGVSRVYAILKNKKEMLNWFSRARAMNTEYDETFVATDIDFLDYRNDKDLIVAAKK
ncbi:MAG: tetratricopeptide repeat protein [Bacteroidetes bacterium]|nr:MAG: tetratricopeptide repeat protein [Bacteroidota bacterium]